MTDVPPEPGSIIDLIERDHRVIRDLLGRFDVTPSDEWAVLFRDLADYLVRHEVAEEEVVFPRVRRALPSVGSTLDDCEAEERRLEAQLVRMSGMSTLEPEFRDELARLTDDLDAHMARESLVVVPMIRSLGANEDRKLASAYEVARAVAPSRAEAALPDDSSDEAGPSSEGILHRLRGVIGHG